MGSKKEKSNFESIEHWPITESEFELRLKECTFRVRFRARFSIYAIIFGPLAALLVFTGTESPSAGILILMGALAFSPVLGLAALVLAKAWRSKLICPYCPTVLAESRVISELKSSGTCSGCGKLLVTVRPNGSSKSGVD